MAGPRVREISGGEFAGKLGFLALGMVGLDGGGKVWEWRRPQTAPHDDLAVSIWGKTGTGKSVRDGGSIFFPFFSLFLPTPGDRCLDWIPLSPPPLSLGCFQ